MYVSERVLVFFFCKQKTAYERRISDWSSDVCSSDLEDRRVFARLSVQENLECGRQPPRAGTRTWSDNDLLDLFPNLAAARHRLAGTLSGGEIGRASGRERVCQDV